MERLGGTAYLIDVKGLGDSLQTCGFGDWQHSEKIIIELIRNDK